jgi:hypothetical protein
MQVTLAQLRTLVNENQGRPNATVFDLHTAGGRTLVAQRDDDKAWSLPPYPGYRERP